jgi:hypothetical protein
MGSANLQARSRVRDSLSAQVGYWWWPSCSRVVAPKQTAAWGSALASQPAGRASSCSSMYKDQRSGDKSRGWGRNLRPHPVNFRRRRQNSWRAARLRAAQIAGLSPERRQEHDRPTRRRRRRRRRRRPPPPRQAALPITFVCLDAQAMRTNAIIRLDFFAGTRAPARARVLLACVCDVLA